MSEKRKKIASVSLKSESHGSIRAELYDAGQWEDGPEGMVRVRLGGKWMDGPDGNPLYLDAAGVGAVIVRMLASGTMPQPAQKPVYAKNQRIAMPVYKADDALRDVLVEHGYILNAEPFLGHDYQWYAIVHGGRNSFCLMPCCDITILPDHARHGQQEARK